MRINSTRNYKAKLEKYEDQYQCTICKETKAIESFGKDKSKKNGLKSACRNCCSARAKKGYRTKNGLIAKIYKDQIQRSIRKKRPIPTYTQDELSNFIFNQNNFEQIYSIWVKNNYDKMLIPSIDRIDDSKFYTISNIQLMTWKENYEKGIKNMRNGTITHGNKPHKKVIQYTLEDNIVKHFPSVSEASRKTGVRKMGISQCCNNKLKTSGNFIWRFAQ